MREFDIMQRVAAMQEEQAMQQQAANKRQEQAMGLAPAPLKDYRNMPRTAIPSPLLLAQEPAPQRQPAQVSAPNPMEVLQQAIAKSPEKPKAPMGPMQALQQRIMKLQSQSLEDQRKGVSDLESQVKKFGAKKDGFDPTPLLLLSDMMSGTNYMQHVQSPEEKQRKMVNLQTMLQDRRSQLTKNETDLLMKQYKMLGGGAPSGAPMDNPFQKEKMKAFGKGAGEYFQKNRPQLLSNLPKISSAVELLSSKPNLTGSYMDKTLGGTGLNLRNPDAYLAQQNMQSAITDTLRPTLGAQFTEAEGKRIMNLTFDPAVSSAENLKRAKALQQVIQNKIEFSDALYDHLGRYGDDRNFDYGKYGMTKKADGSSMSGSSSTRLQELRAKLKGGR